MAKNSKYQELIDSIVDLVGGKDNVSYFAHCVTRLRFSVKDKGLVQKEAVDKISGVLGSQWSGEQYQVIVGQEVDQVYKAICKAHGMTQEGALDEDLGDGKRRFSASSLLDALTGSIIPLTPIIMGYGLIKVLLIVLSMTGLLAETDPTYITIDFVATACLYFLPIYVGSTAAKKFGSNQSIGMVMGGMLMSPTLIAAVSSGEPLSVFGLNIPLVSYASSFFSTILAVYVAGLLEKLAKKYLPAFLHMVLVAPLVILVMIPLNLCFIGPIGYYLGSYISTAMIWVYETIGFVGVVLIAVLKPLLVMTGMHTGFTPYVINAFTNVGYEPFYAVGTTISNVMQGVACVAVGVRSKDETTKSDAFAAAVPALVTGVIEPAMYGVNLRLKTPMVSAMVGSAVAGLYAGLMHVAMYAMSNGGLLGIVGFVSADNPMNIIHTVIALAIGAVVTFVVAFVTYKDDGHKAEAE